MISKQVTQMCKARTLKRLLHLHKFTFFIEEGKFMKYQAFFSLWQNSVRRAVLIDTSENDVPSYRVSFTSNIKGFWYQNKKLQVLFMLKFQGIMYHCTIEYWDCAFAPLAGWLDGWIHKAHELVIHVFCHQLGGEADSRLASR